MTDVLDRAPVAEPVETAPARPPARATRRQDTSWMLAAALAGAAAIHLAMTPSHLDESAVEGTGFLVAAWAQLGLAVAVLRRPTGRTLAAAALVNTVLVLAWVVSRTFGLPFGAHAGHAESVSFVDAACVALEVVAVLLALGVGTALARFKTVALVGTAGAVVLASAAVASPSARDHAAASHGDHGAAHDEMAGAGADHDEGAGGDHGHGATDGTADDLGFSALSNGHQHERGNDEPLSPEETVTLSQQLAATSELVRLYPTIAAAEAAGWKRAGPFSPGLGTHYSGGRGFSPNSDGDMDPEDLLSPLLVFDGLGPDAKLAGFMYMAYGGEGEPEGFAGPNDHWHYHERLCLVFGPNGEIDTPFGADLPGVTDAMCREVGGTFVELTGYMVHLWNVPGYESPDGMFTELNPRITCPDGTYHRIPIDEVGSKDTVCLAA